MATDIKIPWAWELKALDSSLNGSFKPTPDSLPLVLGDHLCQIEWAWRPCGQIIALRSKGFCAISATYAELSFDAARYLAKKVMADGEAVPYLRALTLLTRELYLAASCTDAPQELRGEDRILGLERQLAEEMCEQISGPFAAAVFLLGELHSHNLVSVRCEVCLEDRPSCRTVVREGKFLHHSALEGC